MNFSLTPELEQFIQEKLRKGLYTSASEVVREALRLLHTHESLQKQRVLQMNQAIDIGVDQLSRGKRVSGKVSYEKMKHKIDRIVKEK